VLEATIARATEEDAPRRRSLLGGAIGAVGGAVGVVGGAVTAVRRLSVGDKEDG